MKKICLLLLMFGTMFGAKAQMKLFPTGSVSIGTDKTPHTHNKVFLYGKDFMVGGWQNRFVRFNLETSHPNIWSTSGKIVFYNTEEGLFQDLEVKNVYETSDVKLKKNISTISNALDVIAQLRGTTYSWLQNDSLKSVQDETHTGFVAQETELVLPSAVSTDSLGNKIISYNAILTYAVCAVKELSATIESQRHEIEAVKNEINMLAERNNYLKEEGNLALLVVENIEEVARNIEAAYALPDDSFSAKLVFYDLNKEPLKNFDLISQSHEKLDATEMSLYKGVFYCSLVVDEKEVDRKRVIVL